MAKYAVVFDAFTTTTAYKTAGALHPDAAGELGEIVEAIMTGSGSAAPADRQHRARIMRCDATTAGTGTAMTPEPLQGGAANAARLAATMEYSAEPTVLATVPAAMWGFNQRGGMRWSVPRGEGVWARNSDTKLKVLLQVLSDAAGEVDGHIHHWED